ncbi:MAG: pectate lyase [Prevotella sp.]|nr:pectate lyase [Prevotella sp.]
MRKLYTSRIAMLLMAYCITFNLLAAPKPKKEVYIPMDYSTCGYHASEQSIPDAAVRISLQAESGDNHARIQQALDYVAALKPDQNGLRGCVLLGEGVFRISKPLRITTSGVVLRGADRRKTVIQKTGVERGAAIYVEGTATSLKGDTIAIANEKVMAGSTQLTLQSTKGLRTGSRITIVRPSTKEWIEALRMNDFGGGLDYTGWKATDIDITWDRTITAINGTTIMLDAPITTTLSHEYGGAFVINAHHTGEITECGVENLTIDSEHATWNKKDEDHCWDGVFMNHVRDGWVRRVVFQHLAGSAVNLQKQTSRITIEDCIAQEPVSEIGGWRRQVFLTRGQQTLFQRCVSRQGIHDFAAGYCAAGPNAFVQCEGEESLGFSGSIGSWASGLLFDIVNIDGSDLRYANLEQFQFGTGWNTANSMFWQCTASTIECYSPDSDNRSSGHGCWGTLTGNGEWTSSNDHVTPRSLFYDQLEKRLGKLPFNPHILPRPTNASSSPTVEQAMEMAQESLTQPRLTLEMWLDSIPYLAAVSPVTTRLPKATKEQADQLPSYSIINGHLAADGMLLTGNQYAIPWWSGRVKDNFVQKDAKPAVTRYVPGREGTGWTDRIDSVVNYLASNHYSSLYHHYGLWYDLRRTDHERIRRADGNVWAPFYEQPFSRSGEGTAWDGLSRYDLSKPNRWYWSRLNDFAHQAASKDILLYNEHYFQHNILEAGAHWVDCPWRPVNNINGTDFPEPVPFAGDKRVFMAEQFYNEQDPVLRPLHRQYIRMCLEQTKDQPNIIHSISAEYTGPLHFTRFWLETVAEWEAETGHHPLIALSCTKDVQDSILADPRLRKVVDIIDIRYWHYNTKELWAPEGGRNMAPRQWMRKIKVGKTGFEEAYRSVAECRNRYPEKAVTFFSQQYPTYGWAILMAGGSLPNIPLNAQRSTLNAQLLKDVCQMKAVDGEGCIALGDGKTGYLVYAQSQKASIPVVTGKYHVYTMDLRTGDITLSQKGVRMSDTFQAVDTKGNNLYWLRLIAK